MSDDQTLSIYIAGPMTGHPEFNIPAFHAAAEAWERVGWNVVNPGDLGEIEGWKWIDYMVRDLPLMMRCHAIARLPGWEASDGASLEVLVGRFLGLKMLDAQHPVKPPPTHPWQQQIKFGENIECCRLPEYAHFQAWKHGMKNL